MQMSKQVIYGLIAVLVVGGAILLFRNNGNKGEEKKPMTEQNQEQASLSALSNKIQGCDDLTNLQKDERGRFKPTRDISNKTVTLETSVGNIKVALFDQDAPKTVQNFLCLTEKGFYDGIIFHRVAKGFVIQAGDPTGTGRGGGSIYGEHFEDELYSDTASYKEGYKKGTLAMANAGPNTNSSQFFIMLDNVTLPKNYTIFGKVIEGQEIVDKIGNTEIVPIMGPNDGKPVQDIVIKKATVQ
jgi:peptidylprolyl isomerase